MSTTNKIAPIALDVDATGEKLIKALSADGEKSKGATQKAVDYLFSAMGWRTETIKTGVEANKGRREQMQKLIVAGFSKEKQKLLEPLGEAFKGLDETRQKNWMRGRKAAQQSIGPYIRLIEKGIAKNEDLNASPKDAAQETEEKAKNTPLAKAQKALQTALDILQKMESAPEGVNIMKAIERIKATKGGLPAV